MAGKSGGRKRSKGGGGEGEGGGEGGEGGGRLVITTHQQTNMEAEQKMGKPSGRRVSILPENRGKEGRRKEKEQS